MTDFADIRGQAPAIDLLVSAIASGTRAVSLVGAPGLGPGMIARRVPTLLSPLTDHERVWLEAEREGMDGAYDQDTAIVSRPFVAPHHSIRHEHLLGGVRDTSSWDVCRDMPELRTICRCGRALPAHSFHDLPSLPVPRAGWLHRARFGVLFFDQVDEFSFDTVRYLAHELEHMTGAPFLIATAKPCPCGWLGSELRECICGELSREIHTGRVRKMTAFLGISTTIEIPFVPLYDMRNLPPSESSATLRARIESLRAEWSAGRSKP